MRYLFLIILLFGGGQPVVCQEPIEKKDSHYVISNPEVVKLEVLPRTLEMGENSSVFEKPYTQGDRLYFRLRMTNTSMMPVEVPVGDPYAQDRPVLYKDGDVVAYRKQVSDLVEVRETQISEHARGWIAQLKSNESKILQRFNLYDWYEDLGLGHYQLSVKHRFQPGQSWYESSSITFDIVAKKTVTESRAK
jgi:hypothetical protein